MIGHVVCLSRGQEQKLREHLFQNELEQAAFLFARVVDGDRAGLRFEAEELYLVPDTGWALQWEYHLEMADSERAEVMRRARQAGLALVDCHSHPGAGRRARFSPSDIDGITDFAPYVHWKLDRRPYVAMVWAERGIDGVVWRAGSDRPGLLRGVEIVGARRRWIPCARSWCDDDWGPING
jgi:proteasome lid subunit RPN8/RPN11